MIDLPGETAGVAVFDKPAQPGCAAGHDVVHDLEMLPRDIIFLPIGLAMQPEDVGDLPGRSR